MAVARYILGRKREPNDRKNFSDEVKGCTSRKPCSRNTPILSSTRWCSKLHIRYSSLHCHICPYCTVSSVPLTTWSTSRNYSTMMRDANHQYMFHVLRVQFALVDPSPAPLVSIIVNVGRMVNTCNSIEKNREKGRNLDKEINNHAIAQWWVV